MNEPLLDIHVQGKRYGNRPILADIHLQVAQGETLALVGASGCGKSSLLRIVSGLDRDYRGQVLLSGQPVHGPTPEIRFVFQEPRLFPWLTVAQNVAFDAGGPVARHRARVDALLDEVGLHGWAGSANRAP
ncbi:ATP-binding cassette domain-containing protein [Ideonella sp. B508-1]|uniref:ATP-binding cassette domain-containing protein n=1 Tax=Ideonella sp. B508-1 TaxID=137716 RepID=UPI000345BA12|nr:ATP-binding cassette domain-containing protein [Ideonella sp. B508-1]